MPDARGFRWRIQPVLIASMCLLVIVSIGLLTAAQTMREETRARRELEERGQVLVGALEQVLADALYFDNIERVRHASEIMWAMPEVARYRVFNATGRILVDSESPKYSGGTIDHETLVATLDAQTATFRIDSGYEIVAPVRAGERVLGGVLVSLDSAVVASQVRTLVHESLLYAGVAVVVGVLMAVVLGRWLISPIRRLIHAAHRVSSGDLRFSVASRRRDEIGELSLAFEEMMHKLEGRARAKAEQHTADLEKANELLRQHAMEDALTGLPNRRLLLDRFSIERAKADRRKYMLALLFLDLDEFKEVNDSLGHAAGDEVLLELSRRLRTVVREEDTLARFGGDEFIVLLSGLGDSQEAAGVAAKILDQVRVPVTAEGREFQLTASVGISIYPDHGASAGDLLRTADIAMYRAKTEGKNKYWFFSPGLETAARPSGSA